MIKHNEITKDLGKKLSQDIQEKVHLYASLAGSKKDAAAVCLFAFSGFIGAASAYLNASKVIKREDIQGFWSDLINSFDLADVFSDKDK